MTNETELNYGPCGIGKEWHSESLLKCGACQKVRTCKTCAFHANLHTANWHAKRLNVFLCQWCIQSARRRQEAASQKDDCEYSAFVRIHGLTWFIDRYREPYLWE